MLPGLGATRSIFMSARWALLVGALAIAALAAGACTGPAWSTVEGQLGVNRFPGAAGAGCAVRVPIQPGGGTAGTHPTAARCVPVTPMPMAVTFVNRGDGSTYVARGPVGHGYSVKLPGGDYEVYSGTPHARPYAVIARFSLMGYPGEKYRLDLALR